MHLKYLKNNLFLLSNLKHKYSSLKIAFFFIVLRRRKKAWLKSDIKFDSSSFYSLWNSGAYPNGEPNRQTDKQADR